MGGSSQMSQTGASPQHAFSMGGGDPFMQGHEPAGPGPSQFPGMGSPQGGNMLSSPPPTAAGTTPPINTAPVGMAQPQTPQMPFGAPQGSSPMQAPQQGMMQDSPIGGPFQSLGSSSSMGMFGNNQFQEILQMLMSGGIERA